MPAIHCLHGPSEGPWYPALQLQAVLAILAAGEMEFSGQDRQAELPVDDLYFPGTHYVHSAPSCPIHPALHLQDVIPVLSASE